MACTCCLCKASQKPLSRHAPRTGPAVTALEVALALLALTLSYGAGDLHGAGRHKPYPAASIATAIATPVQVIVPTPLPPPIAQHKLAALRHHPICEPK